MYSYKEKAAFPVKSKVARILLMLVNNGAAEAVSTTREPPPARNRVDMQK